MTSALQIEPLLRIEEVAKILNVSRSWVYAHVNSGEIPYRRLGGALRFDPHAITKYIAGEWKPAQVVLPLRKKK